MIFCEVSYVDFLSKQDVSLSTVTKEDLDLFLVYWMEVEDRQSTTREHL